MSRTMTSWKEIALYLAKGVRTVQRWEREMGLPVRRPNGRQKGVLLAHSDEIDAWMRSHFESEGQTELEALRQELTELRTQNELLRAKLDLVERAASFGEGNGSNNHEDWTDEVLRRRYAEAIEKNDAIRLQSQRVLQRAPGYGKTVKNAE